MNIFSNTIFASKDIIESDPPETFKKVTNIYVEPETGKLVVIHEE